MSTPNVKKPTKKAFHFPKNADAVVETEVKPKAAPAKKSRAAKPAAEAKPAKKAKPAAVAQPATDAVVAVAAEGKTKRVKKEKVVRDSFTMPKSDYDKIAALKQKCLDAGVPVKKSELLRAGLLLLEAAPTKRLVAAVTALETVKTGRPAKSS